jgi:hypothetical protein
MRAIAVGGLGAERLELESHPIADTLTGPEYRDRPDLARVRRQHPLRCTRFQAAPPPNRRSQTHHLAPHWQIWPVAPHKEPSALVHKPRVSRGKDLLLDGRCVTRRVRWVDCRAVVAAV